MKGFNGVTISWDGKDYTIPASEQFGLIFAIEEALTGGKGPGSINILFDTKGVSHSRLAASFEAALRYAGADLEYGEVYNSIVSDMAEGSGEVSAKVNKSLLALMSIIAPPIWMKLQSLNGEDDSAKK